MSSTTAFTTAGKLAFLKGEILAAHTFKYALYTSTATNGAATSVYSTTNEITGTGYTAGGNTLSGYAATTSGTTAYLDWADTSWTSASFTAESGMVYDDTDTVGPKRAIAIMGFGGNQTVTAGTFTIQFPVADATNAIVRLA
ncbi:MAG TPA: hypothetical protein VIY48_21835 [Candidatus Paceibacterota bacterium]